MSYATPTRRVSYTPSAPPSEVASPVSSPSFQRRVSAASSSAGYGASPAAATTDRKKRSRLRDYYGLGKGTPIKAGEALDIDVPGAFDADAYFHSLASSASLPDLLRRENELLNEIRELDGERQSLVYNHHHELIDASDTIRKMKSRAEALDHSLESLKTSFESISQLSTSLAAVTTSARAGNAAAPPPTSEPETEGTDSRSGREDDPEEVLRTPRPHRRQSSRSDAGANTSPTKAVSARRQRSTSSATLSPPSSCAPPAVPTVPFSPLLHLSALLALPIILRSLLTPAASSAVATGADSRARADSLWGTWEPALRSWEDAGVPGVREVGMECREVLRSAAQRRSSMSVGGGAQSPIT